MQLELLENEVFWGGNVADGYRMPMGKETLQHDLRYDFRENQAAPFLVSNMGRYVWSEKAFLYRFDNGHLTLEGEDIVVRDGFSCLKDAYMDAAKTYFPSNGKCPDALMFTCPQYNSWIEMIYEPTGEKMEKYAKSLIDAGYSAGVMMIDDNWQEDYGVWRFHAGRFPEPKKTVDYLHSLGFKVMLWVCNYFSPDSETFRYLWKQGYLVKDKSGDPAIIKWWNGFSGMLDLTNPAAEEWMHGILHGLMDEYGIDGFKFDAGDVLDYSPYVFYAETDSCDYCQRWQKFGEHYTLNEFRSGWKMGGHANAQRLCDKGHSWDEKNGVASLVPNGIAQALMGYSYNCPDMIGGGSWLCFTGDNPKLDQELVVRYAEVAALFPMMQFSVSPMRVLSKENADACLAMAKLHESLGEEIYALVKKSAETSEPVMRNLEFDYPHQGYENVKDQFLLGENIMVAPVVTAKTYERKVIFPAGTWEGEAGTFTGPCEKVLPAPIERLLWFRKKA